MADLSHQHPILQTTAAVCAIAAVVLIAFSFYIMPYLFFDFQYDVPDFIAHISYWYETHHDLGGFLLELMLFLPFPVIGLLLGFIAKRISFWLGPKVEMSDYAERYGTPEARHAGFWREMRLLTLIFTLLVIAVGLIYLFWFFIHGEPVPVPLIIEVP